LWYYDLSEPINDRNNVELAKQKTNWFNKIFK
jgi:hypothetical protein